VGRAGKNGTVDTSAMTVATIQVGQVAKRKASGLLQYGSSTRIR
jgi:hypothetical protein